MILGIHCHVNRGFLAAAERAGALACAAMQMLPYRRHHAPDARDLDEFKQALASTAVKRLLVHSRFVPNLASSDPARRARSAAHLAQELKLAAALGGEAYVLHAGAFSPGSSFAGGLAFFKESVAKAVASAASAIPILVENVPGGGRRMGGTLEEVAELARAVEASCPRAGVCLDTAHAWAAGYDLSSAEGMTGFLAQAHRTLGAGSVRAFHLNDSRALLGSRLENHERWGQGRLGVEGLRTLLQRPDYAEAVGVLEPPAGSAEEDVRSLDLVGRLG